MSDLNPIGVPITLGGVERHFLFTLNVIDEVESHYGMPVIDALDKLWDKKELYGALRYFTTVLVNDEVEYMRHKDPDSALKPITEKEAGWLITVDNIPEVTAAILAAYRLSAPEPDEDDDPNLRSGQQSR